MTAPAIGPTSTMSILEAITPVLLKNRDIGEAEANLPRETVDAMRRAGIFRTWTPAAFGGLEVEPLAALRLVEDISYIDASAGWVAGNSAGLTFLMQSLPESGARRILGANPDAIVAGAGFPLGTAEVAPGGYRVTGQHAFGTGSKWADWFSALNIVTEGGQPRTYPDGSPMLVFAYMPASDVQVLDNWDTLGMRGTGSCDFRWENVFVAEDLAYAVGPLDHPGPAFTGPLYKGGIYITAAAIGAVGLGIARAALDEGKRVALEKTPSYLAAGLADNGAVQRLVARAEAQQAAASAYLYKVIGDFWEKSLRGARPALAEVAQAQLATSFAVESAAKVTEMIHEVCGTTGIRNSSRLARYFRDAHTVSQHGFASAARWDSAGQVLLNRPTDWGFFNF
jgi:alkylation response protein AidB-like acyl-CoA dehydrogenase